jgi:hypothetical protein
MLKMFEYIFRIMRNKAMYNKFKCFGEIIKNVDRCVISKRETVVCLKVETSAHFYRVGSLCCDEPKLRTT